MWKARVPLATELRRGLAPPGLLGCARRCQRYVARKARSGYCYAVSPPYCLVQSYTRPGARLGSTRSVSVGCQLMALPQGSITAAAQCCGVRSARPRRGPAPIPIVRALSRRSFGFPAHRRSNDRRSLIRSRRADPRPQLGPRAESRLPGRAQAPLCGHPRADAACQWRLSSGACSTRGTGRVLDRALPEITDSRNRPLGSRQHPRRWPPPSDMPRRLQRLRRARARSKLRHWTNARHRFILVSNCSSVKHDNNTRKVLTGHSP